MGKTAIFEAKVSDITQVNPQFSKAKIEVMYHGLNRNGSNISKDVVENALPTMYNIPIVGEFVQSKEDFGGHGGKIIISDQGVEFVKTTKPYGVVPESATFSWEEREEDGVTREYLVVDGAFLWTGRYEEAFKILETGKGQSMEVEFTKGNFDNTGKIYNVDEMIFSALCVLGDDVEPCFEGASISESFSNKSEWIETFNAEWREMLKQIADFTLQGNKEGGNNVPDVNATNEFAWSSEQLEGELRRILYTNRTEDDWGWSYPNFWFVDYLPDQNILIASDSNASYLVGMTYSVNGDVVDVDFDSVSRWKIEYVPMAVNTDGDGDADDGITFSLFTKEQLEYNLKVEMAKASKNDDSDNDNDNDTSDSSDTDNDKPNGDHALTDDSNATQDVTQDMAVDTSDDVDLGNGDNNGDNVTNSPDEPVVEDSFSVREAEMQSQIDALTQQVADLTEFQVNKLAEEREVAINELFSQFASQLTEEEIATLREKSSDFTLDELKTQVLAVIGAKVASGQFSLNAGANKTVRVPAFVDEPIQPKSSKPYAHLILARENRTK